MLGLNIKIEGLDGLKKALNNPFRSAMAKTLDTIGERINKEQEKNAESQFKTFGRYSRSSLIVWRPDSDRSMMKQNVVVGTKSSYLRRLETGFKERPMQINAVGRIGSVTGHPIPSRASRKPDGTLKKKYYFKNMYEVFILNVRQKQKIAFIRAMNQLMRVRIIKDTVSTVKSYKWHESAVKKIHKPGLIKELFVQYFNQK